MVFTQWRGGQARLSRLTSPRSSPLLSLPCGYYLTMDGWTETGQKIQPLSKHCQISVQGQSRNRSCRGFVQLLSKSGQISVKLVSNSKSSGHRLDMKIHSLSKLCALKFKMLPFFCIGQYLDIYWTWEKVSGFIF